jgi:O-antigen/teichoic acid export membrane protein
MSIAKSGFRLLLAQVLSTALLFIGLAYFARKLEPAVLGSFFLFRVLNDGVGLLSDFGIRRSVEKRLSENERPTQTFATGLVMKLALVLSFAGLILLLRGPINGYLGAQLAVLLAVSIVFKEMGWYGVHVLRGELRVTETAVVEASRLVVWVGIGVALVELGYGIRGVVYGFIAGFVVLGLWAFVRIETAFGRPSRECVDSILSFSKYDFVSSTGSYVYNWIDVGIIGLFLAQSAVGVYEYAWQVTLPIAIVFEVTTKSVFPQVSQWHASEDTEEISRVVSQAASVGLFLSVPALFGAILFADSILLVLFGPAYVAGAAVLPILMGEKIVRSVQVVLNTTLRGIDQPRKSAIATGVTVLVNLGLNVVLVPTYGIRGAAVATLGSVCLNAVLHWYYLRDHIPLHFTGRLTAKIAGVSLIMSGVLLLATRVLDVNNIVGLFTVVGGGALIYFLLSAFVPTLRRNLIQPGVRVILASTGLRGG